MDKHYLGGRTLFKNEKVAGEFLPGRTLFTNEAVLGEYLPGRTLFKNERISAYFLGGRTLFSSAADRTYLGGRTLFSNEDISTSLLGGRTFFSTGTDRHYLGGRTLFAIAAPEAAATAEETLLLYPFYELLKASLPRGPYSDDDASLVLRTLKVIALGFERARENSDALKLEMFPATAEALIGDWEEEFGIISEAAAPLYLRRQRVQARENAQPGLSILDIQTSLYPFLGYLAEITEYGYFRADDPDSLTDSTPIADEDEVFHFLVVVDGALITTPGFDRAAVQAFLSEIKPAHTQGDITFEMFAADDPYSLTDLDLLSK